MNSELVSQKGLRNALESSDFEVVTEHEIPKRDPRWLSVPLSLHSDVRGLLEERYGHLYQHQSLAIEACLDGNDICLATSTASGKTLVFVSLAAHLLKSDPTFKVLVFYPAKALIQDQLQKWAELLGPLDLQHGFIDGSVPVESREDILRTRQVILMTPDVGHAWLMRCAHESYVRTFLGQLTLLILDEAHVYEGVFGTNMAYFLRRMQAISSPHRLICSTATIGEPEEFIWRLAGRRTSCYVADEDGSGSPRKNVLLCKPASGGDSFESLARLLRHISQDNQGQFLAFADSRRMVEKVVEKVQLLPRVEKAHLEKELTSGLGVGEERKILPYRAGYEESDRIQIQEALTRGALSGVVSTPALELGLDIGEVNLAVLLTFPPSLKSLWQRLGRAGRREPGTCLIVDSANVLNASHECLKEYLDRPVESNWLYLDNRYAQYANALCAAEELGALDIPVDKAKAL